MDESEMRFQARRGRQRQGPGESGRGDQALYALFKLRLLVSSYAALNLILWARIDPAVPKWSCFALAIMGVVDGYRVSRAAGDRDPQPLKFTDVTDAGPEVAAYIAAYLLPLIAAPSPDTWDLIAYGIYAVVIVLVTVNSTLLQVNPTLYVFQRKIVRVTRLDGTQQYLICSKSPKLDTTTYVTRHMGALYSVDD